MRKSWTRRGQSSRLRARAAALILGLVALTGMVGLVSGCGGGATPGGLGDAGSPVEQVQDANTPLADLLPPDELGSRGGEGLLRGGDVGANTMERCTAQDRYVVFHTTDPSATPTPSTTSTCATSRPAGSNWSASPRPAPLPATT